MKKRIVLIVPIAVAAVLLLSVITLYSVGTTENGAALITRLYGNTAPITDSDGVLMRTFTFLGTRYTERIEFVRDHTHPDVMNNSTGGNFTAQLCVTGTTEVARGGKTVTYKGTSLSTDTVSLRAVTPKGEFILSGTAQLLGGETVISVRKSGASPDSPYPISHIPEDIADSDSPFTFPFYVDGRKVMAVNIEFTPHTKTDTEQMYYSVGLNIQTDIEYEVPGEKGIEYLWTVEAASGGETVTLTFPGTMIYTIKEA